MTYASYVLYTRHSNDVECHVSAVTAESTFTVAVLVPQYRALTAALTLLLPFWSRSIVP